jgi:hypothetical protein
MDDNSSQTAISAPLAAGIPLVGLNVPLTGDDHGGNSASLTGNTSIFDCVMMRSHYFQHVCS